ncbi:TPA: hypothetical protein LSH72_001236 [Klebsiella oxytoca]|uniref:hypothetical protein n=1 Tax=Klebsiella oxytoca TaxID=571 RepID=UPI0011DD51EC|nr:hypothetical protein [Klebsiella oxytoca]HBL6734254.1 hypothetical protein [Klebsiella oxytoca]HBL6909057.1 hypothetical protein [Klebsiella oxytoca]
MQKLRIEKPGCWGMIDGVFQQFPVGHEFIAADIPAAFAGRVSVVGEVEDRVLEVASPGSDAEEQPEQPEQPNTTAKSKKGK